MKKERKILSVGGSIIIPKEGFNVPFLKKFRALILAEVKKGERFILVIGGGGTCRLYQDAARETVKMNNTDLDWLGIHSTVFNAQFVRMLFQEHAYKEVVQDPRKKINTAKPIIIAAGWRPGCSTDKDAVLLAKTYGAKHLLNLSNISYVYDKDPNIYPDAKKIEEMNWATFRKEVVGNDWDPGKSAPFDPIASKEAQRLRLEVGILKGTDLPEVRKAIQGKKYQGTRLHS